jgi:hypothetical protein
MRSFPGLVILGMIAFGERTCDEIKAFVDKTTRHFAAHRWPIRPVPAVSALAAA